MEKFETKEPLRWVERVEARPVQPGAALRFPAPEPRQINPPGPANELISRVCRWKSIIINTKIAAKRVVKITNMMNRAEKIDVCKPVVSRFMEHKLPDQASSFLSWILLSRNYTIPWLLLVLLLLSQKNIFQLTDVSNCATRQYTTTVK